MPNDIFRRRIQSAVQDALRAYEDAALIDHTGLRGRVREIVADHLIRQVLTSQFAIGTGKIVDARGRQSAETDIVVYSPSILPPILYSERDGVFPVEACFVSLEVKSRLTSQELVTTIEKAHRLDDFEYQAGIHSTQQTPIAHELTPVICALFAFSSDLSDKTEIERYAERDANWRVNARVKAICVVGKGYWWQDAVRGAWLFHPPTASHDEVVDFLALLSNTTIHSLQRRGRPRLGNYLVADRRLETVTGSQSPVQTTEAVSDGAV